MKLDEQMWGWYEKNNLYYPKMSDMKPDPDSLLKMMRCACKSNSTTFRCSSKMHGLSCSTAC